MKSIRPVLAAAFSLAVMGSIVIWTWSLTRASSEEEIQDRVRLVAEQAALRLEDYLNSRLLSVQLLLRGMESGVLEGQESFTTQAQAIEKMFGGFQALNWIDQDFRIVWVVPEASNQGAEGRSLLDHPVARTPILKASASRVPTMSAPLDLFQGGRGFTAYFPVVDRRSEKSNLLGFVNAVFRIQPLVEGVFDDGIRSDYLLGLYDGEVEVYRSDLVSPADGSANTEPVEKRFLGSADLNMLDRTWSLRLWPHASVLPSLGEDKHRSFLIGGLSFSLAIAFGLWLFLIERASKRIRRREREKFEQQEAQARKMEAIGQLAGGIAHDFNNLLTVISGNVSLASAESPPNGAAKVYLNRIVKASQRASEMTGRLLAFSRSSQSEHGICDVSLELYALEDLLKPLVREDVVFTLDTEPKLGVIQLSSSQLGQVVFNLVNNALDAMPEGGRLTLRASHSHLPEGDFPTARILLEVEDEGIGMAPETTDRVLEPFYTTKAAGQGTGLGLSTTYGIVHAAGGTIEIRSRPKKGTTVRVFLPVVDASTDPHHVDAAEVQPRLPRSRVLVVEDEEAVRQVAVGILEGAGHEVVGVADGIAALEANAQGAPFDLVFSDTVMPLMSGLHLARRLRESGYQGLLLLCSGYTTELSEQDMAEVQAGFLRKPYSSTSLLRKMEALFDSVATVVCKD